MVKREDMAWRTVFTLRERLVRISVTPLKNLEGL